MNWRWTAQRLMISAFLVFHLAAVAIINLPACALKQLAWPPASFYLVPIGLDQAWGMFAPNPVANSMALEVSTVDKDGIRRDFPFPKMTDFSIWRGMPRVRHSKFASNCAVASNTAIREFAVRHAIRQLKIPAVAFPVEADLLFQVRETPPLGGPPLDPMRPPVPQILQTYRFPTLAEVTP